MKRPPKKTYVGNNYAKKGCEEWTVDVLKETDKHVLLRTIVYSPRGYNTTGLSPEHIFILSKPSFVGKYNTKPGHEILDHGRKLTKPTVLKACPEADMFYTT